MFAKKEDKYLEVERKGNLKWINSSQRRKQ